MVTITLSKTLFQLMVVGQNGLNGETVSFFDVK